MSLSMANSIPIDNVLLINTLYPTDIRHGSPSNHPRVSQSGLYPHRLLPVYPLITLIQGTSYREYIIQNAPLAKLRVSEVTIKIHAVSLQVSVSVQRRSTC